MFLLLDAWNGSYKGFIKGEAVYKGINKDYLPEAKPRANDHYQKRNRYPDVIFMEKCQTAGSVPEL